MRTFPFTVTGNIHYWATCLRMTLQSGTQLAFTDYSTNLVGDDGLTYIATAGHERSALEQNAELDTNRVELSGPLMLDGLSETSLRGGLYNRAFCEMFLVSTAVNPVQITNNAPLQAGWLGDVRLEGKRWTVEFVGLAQALQETMVVEVYTPDCRFDLGDARCTVDLSGFTVAGSVASVSDPRRRFTGPAPITAGGVITWTSGSNAGLTQDIKSLAGGEITLFLPMPAPIEPGDEYTATPGCDKSLPTCRDVYDNVLNFGGFPYVPGTDWMFEGPDSFGR